MWIPHKSLDKIWAIHAQDEIMQSLLDRIPIDSPSRGERDLCFLGILLEEQKGHILKKKTTPWH